MYRVVALGMGREPPVLQAKGLSLAVAAQLFGAWSSLQSLSLAIAALITAGTLWPCVSAALLRDHFL